MKNMLEKWNDLWKKSSLIIVILLLMIIAFLQLKGSTQRSSFYKVLSSIHNEQKYHNIILGKRISDYNYYSIKDSSERKIEIVNGIIVFWNTNQCSNCVDHQFNLAMKRNETNKLYYIIQTDNPEQVTYYGKEYKLSDKYYWDKTKAINKIVEFNTDESLPFILVVKNGIIINMEFSSNNRFKYFDDQFRLLNK